MTVGLLRSFKAFVGCEFKRKRVKNKAILFYLFRLTLLQDTHRSHQREYEKYMQDIESSKSTIQNLESSSNHALSYKFYKSMKTYVENLIDCLNEKVYIHVYVIFLLGEKPFYYTVLKRKI
jgi:hypothetical protein